MRPLSSRGRCWFISCGSTGPDRHPCRLRHQPVRRLHVHFNGRAVKSCTMLAVQADGAEVTTIEGLARDGELHPVQAGFPRESRPAMRLLHAGHDHDRGAPAGNQPESRRREMKHALEGNICAAPATSISSNPSNGPQKMGGRGDEVIKDFDPNSSLKPRACPERSRRASCLLPRRASMFPASFGYVAAAFGGGSVAIDGQARRRRQIARRRPQLDPGDEAQAVIAAHFDRSRHRAGIAGAKPDGHTCRSGHSPCTPMCLLRSRTQAFAGLGRRRIGDR